MSGVRWRLAAFLVLGAIQILVPASMIAQHELTLRSGELYRFRTAPVDPNDAFRGKFVALQVEAASVPASLLPGRGSARRLHARIERDESGFAKVVALTEAPPREGDFVTVSWNGPGSVVIGFPFDRFYMEEDLAPRAEEAYRQHSTRDEHDAFITVRVRSGRAAIEDLFIDGRPIREHLRDHTP